jgi:hypothetical protein
MRCELQIRHIRNLAHAAVEAGETLKFDNEILGDLLAAAESGEIDPQEICTLLDDWRDVREGINDHLPPEKIKQLVEILDEALEKIATAPAK